MDGPTDPRQHAPATLRNREPIRAVLARVLAPIIAVGGRVLEVAAGTGEHAVYFAGAFQRLVWQPTDADPGGLASIAAYVDDAALPNLRPPLRLDARKQPWPVADGAPWDAVLSVNMIHIAPWAACEGLLVGAAQVLAPGGPLILYGPFMIDGQHTAPSNVAFDASLKAMNPHYGVRDLGDVAAAAAPYGFRLTETVAMPANNFIAVFING